MKRPCKPATSSKPVPTQMTEQERKEVVSKLFDNLKLQTTLVNLYSRWLDEKEYEDIKEYGKVIEPFVTKIGGKLLLMSKRPFGFKMEIAGVTYLFSMTTRSYTYKRIA